MSQGPLMNSGQPPKVIMSRRYNKVSTKYTSHLFIQHKHVLKLPTSSTIPTFLIWQNPGKSHPLADTICVSNLYQRSQNPGGRGETQQLDAISYRLHQAEKGGF